MMIVYNVQHGGVSEWLKVLDSKSSVANNYRGFESHLLRHLEINSLLNSLLYKLQLSVNVNAESFFLHKTMIQIKNLYKTFKSKTQAGNIIDKVAVDNLTFNINAGEIFGILGKNGAGKTTTIKMLTLQIKPTAGAIYFNGRSTDDNELEIKKIIGVVPQHINFDQDLTVGENMELHARLHHLNRDERFKRINELLEYVELKDVINENVRKLSGGMKRRLLIVRAMIHRPKILFLDEPTVALDPQVRRRIWSLIQQLKSNGVTIVLTTHYIEEAEQLCSRTAFLKRGKLIALDTPNNLCKINNVLTLEDVFIKLTGDNLNV